MEPMVALIEQGMLLESAHGPIPNVAELVTFPPFGGRVGYAAMPSPRR